MVKQSLDFWTKNEIFDEGDSRFELLTDFIKIDLTLPNVNVDVANLWSYWLLENYNEFSLDHVSNLCRCLTIPSYIQRRKIQTLSIGVNSPLISHQPVSIFDSYGTKSTTLDTQKALENLEQKYKLFSGKDFSKRRFLSFIVT